MSLECWRCGKEGADFKHPPHPDGGGQICDECRARMFGRATMMSEHAIRAYRDDLRTCLAKIEKCGCITCKFRFAVEADLFQAQIIAFGIALGEVDASREIEDAAAMARRV